MDNLYITGDSDPIQACSSATDHTESDCIPPEGVNGFVKKQSSILRRSSRQTCLLRKNVQFNDSDSKSCVCEEVNPRRDRMNGSHDLTSGSPFDYLLHLEEDQGTRMAGRISEHRAVMRRILAMFVVSVLCNLPYVAALTTLSVCLPCSLDTALFNVLQPLQWLALTTSFLNQLIVTVMDPAIRQGRLCRQ